MRILGIDPGIERVGIAVVERLPGKKEIVLYSDCFKTSAKLSHPARLVLIGEEIRSVIHHWKPTGLAIEKLFFETNVTTAMKVSEARGVMLYTASSAGLSLFEYTPLEIKVAVTGYGKSDKKALLHMVPLLVTLPKKKMLDDEIDAIAIALTAFAHEKFKN